MTKDIFNKKFRKSLLEFSEVNRESSLNPETITEMIEEISSKSTEGEFAALIADFVSHELLNTSLNFRENIQLLLRYSQDTTVEEFSVSENVHLPQFEDYHSVKDIMEKASAEYLASVYTHSVLLAKSYSLWYDITPDFEASLGMEGNIDE